MSVETVKITYEQLHEANLFMQEQLNFSYIEALHENIQNLANREIQQIDGLPTDEAVVKLEKMYKKINIQSLDKEVIRKVLQLCFLEGDRWDQLPANYQMTPEAIALLMGYFSVKLIRQQQLDEQTVQLFDPAIGTGNLWLIIANELQKNNFEVTGEGYDNDDLLLSIADQNFKLQGMAPRLYLGDALQNLLAKPADLIVSDLPVGYYPLTENIHDFQLDTSDDKQELALTHYLLIEQSLRYLKPNAWGIFLVPSQLINDDKMHTFIKGINHYGYFQALLNLPSNLFRSTKAQKSLLFVQKQGDKAKQAEHVLVGEIPDLKNQTRFGEFINSFNNWLKNK